MLDNVPIRVRVAGAFAVAMALVLVTTGWLLYNRVSSSLLTELDNQLEVRAHDLTDVVKDPEDSLEQSGASKVETWRELRPAGRCAGQCGRRQSVACQATSAHSGRAEACQQSGPIFVVRGALPRLDEPSRVLATHVEQNGKPMVLIVGSTLGNRAETLADLRDELLIAGPIALVLATVAGYFLAGLSLRPVDRMRSRAASISADTPGERLPVPATRDEVQRLGETLNAMLDRLESALERERGFVADAGHELRTPLALLRTELELALRHAESPEELRTAVRGSFQEVDRLAQLAEDLLLIAGRIKGGCRFGSRHSTPPRYSRPQPGDSNGAPREANGRSRLPTHQATESAGIGSGSSRHSETSSTTHCATAKAWWNSLPHGTGTWSNCT